MPVPAVRTHCRILLHGAAVVLCVLFASAQRGICRADEVSFTRDIQPIFANKCYHCHGVDGQARQAGLRLDLRANAVTELESGGVAVVPGKPDESALLQRITSTDDDLRMPPAEAGDRLPEAQIDLLRRWIAEGAGYETHWAFAPVARPELPEVKQTDWVRNPIDRFALAAIEAAGFAPSPETDRRSLLRRASLDLTGLPPTPAEVEAFVNDSDPQAYEKAVDRLLASPRYGEHKAAEWLDLARYADTNGYNNDTPRFMWRWRDWVIEAFNRNLPYDQFLTEQLAGDLLPSPNVDQRIATGFCRNHVITSEGGIIDEEYRLEYVADRVNTMAMVFLGISFQCARCHDHKYDPFTQKDYYRVFAYFNNVPEKGYDGRYGNASPQIPAPTHEQQARLEALADEKQQLAGRMQEEEAQAEGVVAAWTALPAEVAGHLVSPDDAVVHLPLDEREGAAAANPARADAPSSVEGTPLWVEGRHDGALRLNDGASVTLGDAGDFDVDQPFTLSAWLRTEQGGTQAIFARLDEGRQLRGYSFAVQDQRLVVRLAHDWPFDALKVIAREPMTSGQWHHVAMTYDGGGLAAGVQLYVDGQDVAAEVNRDELRQPIRVDQPFRLGRAENGTAFSGDLDDIYVFDRALRPLEVAMLAGRNIAEEAAAVAADARTEPQRRALTEAYLNSSDGVYRQCQAEYTRLSRAEAGVRTAVPQTMVMEELPQPRETFVLARGEYNRPGEPVECGTPGSLPALPEGAPRNRLGLAQWLTSSEHPLTSRVAVNRLWQGLWGEGLVRTPEDFGTRGERPTHPELLDWLAAEFIASGWDMKAMQRLIVTSAAYRQGSRIAPELLERDPENRLLARGPRYRLSAEAVRDCALAMGGLLHEELGGPSVKPYQPAGLWKEVAVGDDTYSGGEYVQDSGPSLYRRGLYTYWKRTCPPPAMNLFDAPEREFCLIRRARTNTPLQALVMWNDPTFVEAARAMAARGMQEAGETPDIRASYLFCLATSRWPQPHERDVLVRSFREQLEKFRAEPEAVNSLLLVGEWRAPEKLDRAELAAWTTVSSMILSLDETLNKG